MMIDFKVKQFSALTVEELYALLKLRVDVFVVEQDCPYHEIDSHDCLEQTRHLLGYKNNVLIAYARLLPAGVTYQTPSIGRVVVDKDHRNQGIAMKLMQQAIDCSKKYFDDDITIGAQAYLQDFYSQFGFNSVSAVYLEDNIEHVDMLLLQTD